MSTVAVVGSGASGVHYALSALQKGHRVLMLDVGRQAPEPVRPDLTFNGLKEHLDRPSEYFLGRGYEGVLYPGHRGEYYGLPPSKEYVLRSLSGFSVATSGFDPLLSFARGGLAEAWTGGSYPFNEAELEDYPFGYEALGRFYGLIAERIGITGANDDLARFLPLHGGLQDAPDLDVHSAMLLRRYEDRRPAINKLGTYMGRSRVATLSRDLGGRQACNRCGRCLWGCPSGSLYTPAQTLDECRRFAEFTYLPGRVVTHFTTRGGRVHSVASRSIDTAVVEEHVVDRLVLGAGTLGSAWLFLHSLSREGSGPIALGGLMDNRQVLMPFVNLGMIGRTYDPETYQYNLVALGLERPAAKEYVHGLLTTLKTALIHPVVQNVPLDVRTSLGVFRSVHAALGLININFHDTRRPGNQVTLEPAAGGNGALPRLVLSYTPPADEPARIRDAAATFKRVLRELRCFVPPGMMHTRPMGASVHYAGTLPMSPTPTPLTTSTKGESHDVGGLFFVDGTSFPFLPAKNLTFTLMANAARIAEEML